MILGSDGMEPTPSMRSAQRRMEYKVLAVVLVANLAVLVWAFWPKQTQGDCMIDMAKKAQGNSTIYASLVRANCMDTN